MVGGVKQVYQRIEPLFKAVAAPQGYAHVGPSGAGHFVKIVHNAIEYGILQVLGEGFSLLDHGRFDIDAAQVAELWNRGSVIRSWLMELVRDSMQRQEHFSQIAGAIGGGSTGSWAVAEAERLALKMPAIELSLKQRQRPDNDYAARIVSALRYEFGRHPFELLEPPPTGERQK
jgi:6-phosphogluconate dehydrogenase